MGKKASCLLFDEQETGDFGMIPPRTGMPSRPALTSTSLRGPGTGVRGEVHTGDFPVESCYTEGAVEFTRQVLDGRMGDIGTVRDDGPFVTGRPSTTLRQWAETNRERLMG
jgi:hypothetical protein